MTARPCEEGDELISAQAGGAPGARQTQQAEEAYDHQQETPVQSEPQLGAAYTQQVTQRRAQPHGILITN